jgi:twitching motility protein PilT
MGQVDGLLKLVAKQGAGLLRLRAGEVPQALLGDKPVKVFLPSTPDEVLRELLAELLPAERQDRLSRGEVVSFPYDSKGVGSFTVDIGHAEAGLWATFTRKLLAEQTEASPQAPDAEAPLPHVSTDGAGGGAAPAELPAPLALPVASALLQPAALAPLKPLVGEALVSLVPLLERALQEGASDLHLAEREPVMARIDGRLQRLDGETVESAEIVLASLWTDGVSQRLSLGRSVDLGVDLPSLGRFRVHLFTCDHGRAAAIRILRRQAPTLASLQLPAKLDDLLLLPHGVVLLCGPTGSGKSTTAAALARAFLRKRGGLLVTLEDPIEYGIQAEHPSALVRQREIGRHTESFAAGLRDAMREDPDLLLVGEMRDPESIALALTAGETGHLVLTTLHSRSSANAIERIIDTYPPERQRQIRVQLADGLRAVVTQRLLPRAKGRGRVVALEILRVNSAVASMIRDGKTAQIPTALQSGQGEGMLPLEKCLAELVREEAIRVEDARAVANDLASLQHFLRQGAI